MGTDPIKGMPEECLIQAMVKIPLDRFNSLIPELNEVHFEDPKAMFRIMKGLNLSPTFGKKSRDGTFDTDAFKQLLSNYTSRCKFHIIGKVLL